ncbi:uncharacterized protein J3D65DRAFT_580131 [Phyllosticta citribraziliensis]|uniref:Uncharacterized protein n=1 Tax=Phyllosticta citribraziliensis TaxID=989973 RepID=A0ABR1L2K4_9PEZI
MAAALALSPGAACVLAPLSFVYNVGLQFYGLFSTPNMKDVNDANLSVFSPQPYMVALFFFPLQVAQVLWMVRLWRVSRRDGATAEKDVAEMTGYAGVLVLGNACIGTWLFFWNSSHLGLSNIFVAITTLAHLLYLTTALPPLRRHSSASFLTHAVAKAYTGISVLDMLHNTSAAFYAGVAAPSGAVKVLTGVGFAVGAALGDWMLGACLVYDLAAFSVGQRGRTDADPAASREWSHLLGWYILGTAAIVLVKNLCRPPYPEEREEYTRIQEDDEGI